MTQVLPEMVIAEAKKRIPMRRVGQPEEPGQDGSVSLVG